MLHVLQTNEKVQIECLCTIFGRIYNYLKRALHLQMENPVDILTYKIYDVL